MGFPKAEDSLTGFVGTLGEKMEGMTETGIKDLVTFMADNPFAREALQPDSDHPSQTMALMAIALEICTHGWN